MPTTTTNLTPPDDGLPDNGLVFVVDDVEPVRRTLVRILSTQGYETEAFPSGEALLSSFARTVPDAIYLDLNMPGLGGLETLKRIRVRSANVPVVMLTGDDDVATVVESMKLGAYDYLLKPPSPERLLAVTRSAVKYHRMSLRSTSLEDERGSRYPEIVGESTPMLQLLRQMDQVAASDIALFIHGESGTGKELVARGIHAASSRTGGPFVAVNCAAIPESLQESEFFGHEKGAFTGATEVRVGRFEMADGGTLFLDEVAELAQPLQAKLLRVLQDNLYHRVGGSREIRSDFRLITATNRDLSERVEEGTFRDDLYFRIVVCELELPPLRERLDDVKRLTRHFLDDYNERRGVCVSISPEALQALTSYSWPGNVRELHNVLQRAIVFAESGVVHLHHLPSRLVGGYSDPPQGAQDSAKEASDGNSTGIVSTRRPSESGDDPPQSLEALEARAIRTAIQRADGNVSKAARILGVSRATLYRKLSKLQIR